MENAKLAEDVVGSESIESKILTIYPSILRGQVKVSGAKNSALRLLAASLLTSEDVFITNYPEQLLDAIIHVEMLEVLGKRCEVADSQIKIVEDKGIASKLVWEKRSIRNSLLILSALVARTGYGEVPLPGGCNIGASRAGRGYDIHAHVLESLGAKIFESGNNLVAEAPNGLKGTDIHLRLRSTGATESAILASSLAQGVTRIWNPHVRPEIINLIELVRKMGAKIEVFGQERIEVHGVTELRGAQVDVIPDNVEALTWLIAAAITDGEVEIVNFPFEHLEVPLIFLRESGINMFRGDQSVVVRGGDCYPLELSTGPYPGINSDMQPLLAVFGAMAQGESRFIDMRFPGRYGYAEELSKMGMDYKIEGNVLRIYGGHKLTGTAVQALDLRAGAALSLAALVAKGPTHIHNAWQILRGYSSFVEKAQSLGIRISSETI